MVLVNYYIRCFEPFNLFSFIFLFFHFKIIILCCLMREGSSQTVNITCMPSVTGYRPSNNLFRDVIICKWLINGVDHYDTETQATTDCTNIGYSNIWSKGYLSNFQTTPTDQW